MLFNSFEFLLFLIFVFCGYWFVFQNYLRAQNFFIFFTSYIFYGWWDWRFLFLISSSSLFGYFSVLMMDKAPDEKRRKYWMISSVAINLLFLGFFKYFNFFSDTFESMLEIVGLKADIITLSILLPIGISFYTFHNISYVVDVYRRQIPANKDIIVYLSFISYFPQLVAGPIQRAKDLIPQFQQRRVFNYSTAINGLEQALWGFFKKIVIADNCAVLANSIFDNYQTLSSIELMLGTIYFAFQIYGDFSGYTDIALGISKLFGINLTTNFRTPYFSQSIPEFWKRWHISLTTWFKDYVYIPLGGSKLGKWITIRNTMIIFLISGLWHGANLTFIFWGLINALFFIPSIMLNSTTPQKNKNDHSISIVGIVKMLLTFTAICFAWIFFRAESITHAFNYINSIVHNKWIPDSLYLFRPFSLMPLLVLFLYIEWIIYRNENRALKMELYSISKWSAYLIMVFTILMNIKFHDASEFIYFQF